VGWNIVGKDLRQTYAMRVVDYLGSNIEVAAQKILKITLRGTALSLTVWEDKPQIRLMDTKLIY
jgi:hypothetical protein